MPRPKGSKNKKSIVAVENIDERIERITAEIQELADAIKAKKAELKQLNKAKEAEAERVAAQEAEERKASIFAAIEASGKSMEEVLSLLGSHQE